MSDTVRSEVDKSRDRNLSIADGLILVAGVAAGMALVRLTNSKNIISIQNLFPNSAEGWTLQRAFNLLLAGEVLFTVPFMAAWTPACLLVQMRGSQWRRLRRRPGFIACLIASTITLAMVATAVALIESAVWTERLHNMYYDVSILCGALAGWGVLWGWVAMRLCGVSRPTPTWADRLGRATGAVWVAAGLLGACELALFFWLGVY